MALVLKLMEVEAQPGGSTLAGHMMTLYALARWTEGDIVEVGVGCSTVALLVGLEERAEPGRLISVDVDQRKESDVRRYAAKEPGWMGLDLWRFLHTYSPDAAHRWQGRKVGLVFIDGDHREVHVAKELESWSKLLLPKGVMCGHDYLNTSVVGRRRVTGVGLAVRKFLEKHPGEWDKRMYPNDCGLWVLTSRR
jgi:predicted O-methyltransferase YrrM